MPNKNRLIQTRFWSDPFIQSLSPMERYFYLYLLTNEHTKINGVYEITTKTMAMETDLSVDRLSQYVDRLSQAGKIVYLDNYMILLNFRKNQQRNPSVDLGIKKEDALLPHYIAEIIQTGNRLSPVCVQDGTFESESKSKSKSKENTNTPSKEGSGVGTPHPGVELLFSTIQEITGLPAVAGKQARQYAYNLVRQLEKDCKDAQTVEGKIVALVKMSAALGDNWHTPKTNDPKHLFYHWQEIVQMAKAKKDSSRVLKL